VLCTDNVYSAELGLIQGEEKGKGCLPKGRAPIYVLVHISCSEMEREEKRDERRNARPVPGCALSARVTGRREDGGRC
jgi:hypothetical protein